MHCLDLIECYVTTIYISFLHTSFYVHLKNAINFVILISLITYKCGDQLYTRDHGSTNNVYKIISTLISVYKI